jgi:hypothetical protein
LHAGLGDVIDVLETPEMAGPVGGGLLLFFWDEVQIDRRPRLACREARCYAADLVSTAEGPCLTQAGASMIRSAGATTREACSLPKPTASPSIVRHILQLDGYGAETPYFSTTEDEDVAARFAGKDGRVWFTSVDRVQGQRLRYISKAELLGLLRGKGKGDAAAARASDVMAARALVEQHAEHLVDFRSMRETVQSELVACVGILFTKARP